MSRNPKTPWHKASYDQFLNDTLPQLLAERLPLAGYQVIDNEAPLGSCTLLVELTGGAHATYPSIPRPDEAGLFHLNGKPYVVVPLASQEELDQAQIACAGEQLFDYIRQRLGQTSNGLAWDEEILRAWLPLERWVNEFLQSNAQLLDTTNWLSRHTHLRRILIPNRQKVVAPGQAGLVCPFETPEGPNIGKVFTVALGAEIRERRLVIVDERPEAGLGLSASMLPFLEHNDPNRLLMAANMLRQGIPMGHPEPAWVQTGLEPDAPDFWCGHNLLTAFVSWGPGTSEDGILLSESAARKMNDPCPVEPGDKLSNRHGSKGVVSYILPDEQMPHLPDGTPVELVYNFPGLRTRMHLGQVREAVMSRIARAEGAPAIVPPFHAPSTAEIRQRLVAAGLPESGMERLTLGKNGPALELPSTAGWVYWSRLDHLVKDKIRVALDDADSAEKAGQLVGELEFGVLKALGATATMHEALNERSARKLLAGTPSNTAALTPMFNELTRRLNMAGIRAELKDGQLGFHFTLPEGQVLELARPQPHPWLSERLLETVGAPAAEESDGRLQAEFAALAAANEQLKNMLTGRAPERLVLTAEARLRQALEQFFAALLPAEMLRFRERQRFSGRTVVAPGIDLGFDQIGLPETLCWALFGRQVASELQGETPPGLEDPRAVQALDDILARSWVTINHAMTFSSTSLLAFHPRRIPGRAIRLNPVLCRWMNTDFDGDQVAFFLPLSAAAQQEAEELLSVRGQLTHNPSLAKTLLPPPEVVWGLAWRSLTQAGRNEIARLAGVAEQTLGPLLTQAGLADLLWLVHERDGLDAMLEVLQKLSQLGYQAAQASGASMSAFIQLSEPLPSAPQDDDPERWEIYTEALSEQILSSTDYHDPHLGPQLLDAHARAWNQRSLPMVVGVRGVVTGVDGSPAIIKHGYAQGLTPTEMFACVAGARQGFAQIHVQSEQMIQEARKAGEPGGLNLLARARRARHPGIVFARAAATGETDRLEDVDARLMVGVN